LKLRGFGLVADEGFEPFAGFGDQQVAGLQAATAYVAVRK
jgi:hypothetical protein